jgi:hypothetical protein
VDAAAVIGAPIYDHLTPHTQLWQTLWQLWGYHRHATALILLTMWKHAAHGGGLNASPVIMHADVHHSSVHVSCVNLMTHVVMVSKVVITLHHIRHVAHP